MLHGPTRVIRITVIYGWSSKPRWHWRTEPCEHAVDCALQPEYMSKVLITSAFEPRPIGKKAAIAQVKPNPEAQLLCCDPRVKCVLQSDYRLTCVHRTSRGSAGYCYRLLSKAVDMFSKPDFYLMSSPRTLCPALRLLLDTAKSHLNFSSYLELCTPSHPILVSHLVLP